MKKSIDIHEKYSFTTQYTHKSEIDDIDVSQYCMEIQSVLFAEKYVEGEVHEAVEIGKFTAFKLLLGDALVLRYSSYDVFDCHQETMDIGEKIFNFNKDNLKMTIENFYGGDIFNPDILILSRIEILPEFQGYGLSKKWINQILSNFSGGCGIVVAKSYPLQLEGSVREGILSDWDLKMGYLEMDKDEKKVRKSLIKHYQSMGFKTIPKISQEIVFFNPAWKYDGMG